ncbi:MAG: UDP-N-acetylglucosamine 1-carboxyvinyltransferase [Gemmatimonadota bacterium]
MQGTVRPAGNKNEALPAIAAALLSEEPVTLSNVPEIADVHTMLDLAAALGGRVERPAPGRVVISAGEVGRRGAERDLGGRIRGSFLLAAPLLARNRRAELARPGGDAIGRRRVDTHLHAFRALGADVELHDDAYRLSAPAGLRGAEIFLDEASVMGTENAVMAAVAAHGDTTIANAASEPHVQGLCRLLRSMGAEIDGVGTNALRVRGADGGRPRLGAAEHVLMPDHIEVGSFIGLAAVTGGGLRIEGAGPANLRMILLVFQRLGVRVEVQGEDLWIPPGQDLEVVSDVDGAIPRIDDAPWPGFPADLTSIALVTATRSRGTVLIHEKMFESRLFFVDKLISMGARIVLCDPHRAVVSGPARLRGARISSPDIRAGMALLIAALSAHGRSEIGNIGQIDRGYERIDERLRALGAEIQRVGK